VSIPTFLALLVVGLAGYRLTRVVTSDSISDPFRAWLWDRAYTHAGMTYDFQHDTQAPAVRSKAWRWVYDLLSCPYCLGFWLTLAVWWGYTFGPEWVERGVEALAAVGVQAFIASRRDA